VVVLGLVPWSVRNQVQVGTWNLVTSNGFNLAATYSREAQAAGTFVDPTHDPSFERYRLLQFDEGLWSAVLTADGVAGLRSSPSAVVGRVGRNVLATFELRPSYNDGPEALDGRNLTARRWSLPAFYLVTALGLVGLWRLRREPAVGLLVVMTGSFVVLNFALLAPPRLRSPLDRVAGGPLVKRVGGLRRGRRRAPSRHGRVAGTRRGGCRWHRDS
jgi:hypothetical protein